MGNKRISSLVERIKLTAEDFFAIDKASEADTKKLPASYFTDQFSDMQNILGAKNLLPNIATAKEANGITFTVNSDGSVTINGTASTDTFLNIDYLILAESSAWELSDLIGKSLIASISNTAIDGVVLGYGFFKSDGTNSMIGTTNTSAVFTFPSNAVKGRTFIKVSSGKTVSNKTVYPMVRPASIADDTYVPYTPTNKQLLSYADNGILGAKNLLSYPYYETTKTENGLTFTVNSDGTITVNGTASANTAFYLSYLTKSLKAGRYILSGCTGGSSTTYNMTLFNSDYSVNVANNDGDTSFIMPSDGNYYCRIHVKSGQTLSNVKFKPMIRLASDSDSTYQPYAKTNKQLTDDVTSLNNDLNTLHYNNGTLISVTNGYTCPYDGYIQIYIPNNTTEVVTVNSQRLIDIRNNSGNNNYYSIFVKKGSLIGIAGSGTANFIPFTNKV